MTKQKLSIKTILTMTLIFAVLVFVDLITKYLASLNGGCNIMIIDGFFGFVYDTNKGASFSFLSNVDWGIYLLIAISILASVALFVYLFFIPEENWLYRIIIILICAGAFANLIDRALLLEVRDFLYFPWFANCNIADVYVVVGAVLFALYVVFWDKDCLVNIIKAESQAKKEQKQNDEVDKEDKNG